ncbi:MAG: RnfH family protein [Burkholderiales bacterium]|nr:RnfH family protein [Burkholderiales bacterium]
MRVEVVYALPRKQERVMLDLVSGSSVQDAIQASGLGQIALGRVGIWGRPVSPETRLREQDRVEIYRPLTADPKEVRRKRAAKTRK